MIKHSEKRKSREKEGFFSSQPKGVIRAQLCITFLCMYVRMYICMCAYMYVCMHVCVYVYYVYMYACISYVWLSYVCVYTFMHVCMYVYVCLYWVNICMYVCMHVHIYVCVSCVYTFLRMTFFHSKAVKAAGTWNICPQHIHNQEAVCDEILLMVAPIPFIQLKILTSEWSYSQPAVFFFY